MNRRNKTQKNLKRSMKRKYSGGDNITSIKVTEIIDLILENYNHPEYRKHLITFIDELQIEYNLKYLVKDIKDDIVIQRGIIESQQKSLRKSDAEIKDYINNYFLEIDGIVDNIMISRYSHKENIQSLINGKYYYKPMIANLVGVALNNIKKFITDKKSHHFNKIITTHMLTIIFDIIKDVIKDDLLSKNTLFHELKNSIANKYRNINEQEERQNKDALERVEKLLLRILYLLIDNIIRDPKVLETYLSIIKDKVNENGNNSILNNIKTYKKNIDCYLSHSEYYVDLLTYEANITTIKNLISNKPDSNDINTGLKLLFGTLLKCNVETVGTVISNSIFNYFHSNTTGDKEPKIGNPKRNKTNAYIQPPPLTNITDNIESPSVTNEPVNNKTKKKKGAFHKVLKTFGFSKNPSKQQT